MDELLHVLANMKSEDIQKFLLRQETVGLIHLFTVLEYADTDTQKRWVSTYNELTGAN